MLRYHQYYDNKSVGELTCMGCPPTKRLRFPRGAASSWLLVMVRQLRTALPKWWESLVTEMLQSS